MLRRNFLSTLASLPFLSSFRPTKEIDYQPLSRNKIPDFPHLGIARKIIATQNTEIDMYYCSQIATFPILTELSITYDKGEEVWQAYNVKIEDLAQLTLKSFFSEHEVIPDKFVPTLKWKDYKFKLSHIMLEDDTK